MNLEFFKKFLIAVDKILAVFLYVVLVKFKLAYISPIILGIFLGFLLIAVFIAFSIGLIFI